MPAYPVDEILPRLHAALSSSSFAVLSAPPGAGKTTRVPPSLLSTPWLAGKRIIMLEPRRLAARRAAEYIASQMGERVGDTVGYRIRGEARVGKNTRIEIVTEGILTRMLLHDQALEPVGCVIFDEFHERSIHADVGLALTLDAQRNLRPDLHILVMSATLDGVAVSRLLGDAPIVESEGRMFPVTTKYASFANDDPLPKRIADTVLRAMANDEGDVLVFLPGVGEIRRCAEALEARHLGEDIHIHQLYGDANLRDQLGALEPAPSGMRKVILSTSIAETSLTIDGVRIVVDAGLVRTLKFDPRRGMSGLMTVPVSKATADQRRGRSGRQAPGVCYRLWTEADHASLPNHPTPEIKATDLAHLALDLAVWGDPLAKELRFLDPPPTAHLEQARNLLTRLGALDERGSLTSHGKSMADVPLHPRLSHMILRAKALGHGSLACDVAALLEERDFMSGRKDSDIDLESRWHALTSGRSSDRGATERISAQADRFRETLRIERTRGTVSALGTLLGLAYPDRVARRKEDGQRYHMAGGGTAVLPKGSMLDRHEYLAIGDVDGAGASARIYLAAPVSSSDLREIFANQVVTEEQVTWSVPELCVVARKVRRVDALILDEKPMEPRGERVVAAMLDGIRSLGIGVLPWDKESRSFQARLTWAASNGLTPDWPGMDDEALMAGIEDWLGPFLDGIWKKDHLTKVELLTALKSCLSREQQLMLEKLAPSHVAVPSGSRIAIEYGSSRQPVLAVKLQEMFGQIETPTVGAGKIPVVVHLLSPAKRPLAVTQDLPSFWKNTYPKLRRQMQADYPKHPWPEDPLTATPTKKTVRRK